MLTLTLVSVAYACVYAYAIANANAYDYAYDYGYGYDYAYAYAYAYAADILSVSHWNVYFFRIGFRHALLWFLKLPTICCCQNSTSKF